MGPMIHIIKHSEELALANEQPERTGDALTCAN